MSDPEIQAEAREIRRQEPAAVRPSAATMSLDTHPFLRQCGGSAPGRIHPLILGDNLLGREATAEIFLDRADVSRRHARLTVTIDAVIVDDLASKNGVLVGGAAIHEPTHLAHGDRFQVGELVLEVNHPGAKVAAALTDAGEATMTYSEIRQGLGAKGQAPLRGPVLATLFFATIIAILLVYGATL